MNSLIAGVCHEIEDSPDVSVIRFRTEIPSIFLLCLIVLAILLCLSPVPSKACIVIIAVTGLVVGSILPIFYIDEVLITRNEIRQDSGFWFDRSYRGFIYADVEWVTIRSTQKGRGEGSHTARVWVVHRKDGAVQEVSGGDLWDFNESFVVKKLQSYGVVFR